MLPAPQPGPGGDDGVLVALGSGQGLVGAGEDRARVRHRLVEEQAIEVVSEVVVRLDVAAAATDRVPPRPVGQGPLDPEW